MSYLKGTLVAALLFSVCACSKVGKEQAEFYESTEKKICACTDGDCAKPVIAELVAYEEKNKTTKVSKEFFDRIKASGEKIVACATKIGVSDAQKLDDSLPPAEE